MYWYEIGSGAFLAKINITCVPCPATDEKSEVNERNMNGRRLELCPLVCSPDGEMFLR